MPLAYEVFLVSLTRLSYLWKSLYPNCTLWAGCDTTVQVCCVGGFEPQPAGFGPPALPLRLTTHTRLPSERHLRFQPGRMSRPLAGSTSKKPLMRHPVGARTPISRVRILFPNLLEDRTINTMVAMMGVEPTITPL